MIECFNFKSVGKGPLLGFADLYIDKWGVEIKDCALFHKDGARWLSLPSKQYTNAEGETKYAPLVRFRNTEHLKGFSSQAIKAIEVYCAEKAKEHGGYETISTQFVNVPNHQTQTDIPF